MRGRVQKAVVAFRKGQYGDAIGHYEHVLAADAGHKMALTGMMAALKAAGRAAEMEPYYQRALELSPGDVDLLGGIARLYKDIGRSRESLGLFTFIAKAAPLDFAIQCECAEMLLQFSEFDEAAEVCRRALAFEPAGDDALVLWTSLGIALYSMGREEEALEAYRSASPFCKAGPAHFINQTSIVFCLQALGRAEERIALLENIKASLRRWKLGDLEHAKVLFWISLSEKIPLDSPMHKEVLALAAKSPPPDVESFVQYTLGRIYADAKKYDSAYPAFVAGGKAMLNAARKKSREGLEIIDRVRETFTPQLVARLQGRGNPSKQPIFVVGMPRTGTTLLEQVLNAIPGVVGAGELGYLWQLAAANTARAPEACAEMPFPKWLERPDADDVLRLVAGSYLYKSAVTTPDALRVVDKLPGNFVMVGVVALAFPNAKIIHARRNPLDTCVANLTTLFDKGYWASYDPAAMGEQYRSYLDLMEHWHRLFPGRILDVHYEDVVADLEGQSRRIVDYLGLPWDPAILSFHESSNTVRTASFAQVRNPIYNSSVGRWKVYEKHLGPLIEALGPYGSAA